jgi:hypothetical protein
MVSLSLSTVEFDTRHLPCISRAVEKAQRLERELYTSYIEEANKSQQAATRRKAFCGDEWRASKKIKTSALGVRQLVDGVEDHDLLVPSMRAVVRER